MTHPDPHRLTAMSLVDRIIVVICFMLALGLGLCLKKYCRPAEDQRRDPGGIKAAGAPASLTASLHIFTAESDRLFQS
jgi:hypothetical protein